MAKKVEVVVEANERVKQGDILRDVEFIESVSEHEGVVEISKILFPYVIVLSQDCDLEQDLRTQRREADIKTNDKYLLSILVAPIYNYEHVHQGTHLSLLDWTMAPMKKGGTETNYLVSNQRARYHFLSFPKNINIVDSVIDFKHYFSVSVSSLIEHKKSHYVCTVKELFREDISVRFANFLSRIGLPEPREQV
jgi:hypothetical protein